MSSAGVSPATALAVGLKVDLDAAKAAPGDPAGQGRSEQPGHHHYDDKGVGNNGVPLALTPPEKADLVEYLKSL
jgi:hypothetical protein